MKVVLCIEKLIPNAQYFGSMTDDTKEYYECLDWRDTREKPTWNELKNAWKDVEDEKKTAKYKEMLLMLLNKTAGISQKYWEQKRAVERGLTPISPLITEDKMDEISLAHDFWVKRLKKLDTSFKIKNYTMEQIKDQANVDLYDSYPLE